MSQKSVDVKKAALPDTSQIYNFLSSFQAVLLIRTWKSFKKYDKYPLVAGNFTDYCMI